jgi:hypothetical protein
MAVSGSYRRHGATHLTFNAAIEGAQEAGAEVEVLDLLDINFAPCTNCMACWRAPTFEEALKNCPRQDDLTLWIGRLPDIDGLILSSPVNVNSLTALMKKFMERCAPLAEFKPLPFFLKLLVHPSVCPLPRLKKRPRVMLWITGSSAPAWIGRLMFRMAKMQFKAFHDVWPARLIDFIWVGGTLAPQWKLPIKTLHRARAAGARMGRGDGVK